MLRKSAILATTLVLGLSMATAQSNQANLQKGPGMIKAGSPVYGLELAVDSAALGLGLANPGALAKERAAEAHKAALKNNTKAAARAGEQLAQIAKKTSGNRSDQEIQNAMNSFQNTMNMMEQQIQNAPNENARKGMENALENMRTAFQNMQEAQNRREEAGRTERRARPENPGNRTPEQTRNRNRGERNLTDSPGSREPTQNRGNETTETRSGDNVTAEGQGGNDSQNGSTSTRGSQGRP